MQALMADDTVGMYYTLLYYTRPYSNTIHALVDDDTVRHVLPLESLASAHEAAPEANEEDAAAHKPDGMGVGVSISCSCCSWYSCSCARVGLRSGSRGR